MTTDTDAHTLTFCRGWGTRGARQYVTFYCRRKPTIDEAVEILRARISPNANRDWFEPHNSGLVTIERINWEAMI